jgi:hypothetical protein
VLDQGRGSHHRFEVDLHEVHGVGRPGLAGDAHPDLCIGVGEGFKGGAGIVEGQDLVERDPFLGRLPGAPLTHAHPVAPAAAGKDEVTRRGDGRGRGREDQASGQQGGGGQRSEKDP